MRGLIRPYGIGRGVRLSAMVLLGFLTFIGLGYLLPMTPLWVLLRVGLLFAALTWVFLYLKSPALSFFLVALLGLLLLHQPLEVYVAALVGQAQSLTVFMIVLFGATLAVVSRQDLLDELARRPRADAGSPDQSRLYDEAAVFCLLRRFDHWIQRRSASKVRQGLLLFLLALTNFVSSTTAVLLFKSLWAPGKADFLSRQDDRALAAGILCLCMSGVLPVYFYTGTGWMMSGWWLFFADNISRSNVDFMPRWPVGVYLYGLLSFMHGFWLIFGRSRAAARLDPEPVVDVVERRRQGLYLFLLIVCVVAVAGTFVLFKYVPTEQQAASPTLSAAQQPLRPAQREETIGQPSGVHQPTPSPPTAAQSTRSEGDRLRLLVSSVFLGLLLAALLAQLLMYTFFMRPADELWRPSAFWNLMLDGMGNVFRTVVTLVVLLAFKDLITQALTSHKANLAASVALLGSASGQAACIGLVLALAVGIGRIIGSSWGTFALGMIMLDIVGVTQVPTAIPEHYGRTVVEALILLSTWINQSSSSADNAQVMLGPAQCTPEAMRSVWAVPTFARYPGVRARQIQWVMLVLSVGLALLCHYQWPDVI